MTSIDSIQLSTSTDFIKSLDMDKFMESEMIRSNDLKVENLYLSKKDIGIDMISINKTFGIVNIKASSKILGENYHQGICYDTLDQFIDMITLSGLELDQDFVSDCKLKRVDIKDDLKLQNNVPEYLTSLNHLNADKFIKTPYPDGIVFKEKIQHNPYRLIGYSKGYEIIKNKAFYKQFPEVKSYFDNILRIESRLSGSTTIKKHLKSNQLLDILDSTNVNYSLLNKIINKQTNYKSFKNTSTMTNTEEKNFGHIYMLNDYYNGDVDKILNHIKNKLSKNTNPSYQKKITLKYLAMIKNTEDNFIKENITEIQDMLNENKIFTN